MPTRFTSSPRIHVSDIKILVHGNSHFNAANMENEVYSERSMSMHSLCSIFFFCCRIRSVSFSSAAISFFNRHSYIPEEAGTESKIPCLVERTSDWLNTENQTDTALLTHLSEQASQTRISSHFSCIFHMSAV